MKAQREKKIFIKQLEEGQQFSDLFLVSRKKLAETKAGKPYLALALMDKTGEIEARVWDQAVKYDALAEVGQVVWVQATAKSFRDQLQLGVGSIKQVEAVSISLSDYMAASPRSLAEMEAELDAVITNIGDSDLCLLLREIFQGETLARFVRAPAAKKMHHAYIGGLLEHTLSIVGMAEKAAAHYSELDRDLLIAGSLLHDIAKISEFDYSQMPITYTDKGRLVGHLVLGTEMVRKAARKVEGINEQRVDLLVHIILSHHGQYDYGSPVLPMTPEAILLHHLDDMDAKMNYMEGLREKLTEPGWGWTEYQRPLERFLYLHAQEDGQDMPSRSPESLEPVESETDKSAPPRLLKKGEAEKRQQSLF